MMPEGTPDRQLLMVPRLTRVSLTRSYQDMLTSQPTLMDAAVLRALADPLRRRMVELLADEHLCTCHLAAETGASQTNVSNHLRVLREAGLLVSEPAGRYTYHRLVADRFEALAAAVGHLSGRACRADAARRPCT